MRAVAVSVADAAAEVTAGLVLRPAPRPLPLSITAVGIAVHVVPSSIVASTPLTDSLLSLSGTQYAANDRSLPVWASLRCVRRPPISRPGLIFIMEERCGCESNRAQPVGLIYPPPIVTGSQIAYQDDLKAYGYTPLIRTLSVPQSPSGSIDDLLTCTLLTISTGKRVSIKREIGRVV